MRHHPPRAPRTQGNTSWSGNRDRTTQRHFRETILERDGYRCRECNGTYNLRACHIIPISQGGTNTPDNGVTRCQHCDVQSDPYAR